MITARKVLLASIAAAPAALLAQESDAPTSLPAPPPPAAAAPAPPAPSLALPTIRPIRGSNGRTVNFEIREVYRDGFVGVAAEQTQPQFIEWMRTDLGWLAEFQRDLEAFRHTQPAYTGNLRGTTPQQNFRILQPNSVTLNVESQRSSATDTRWADGVGSFDRDTFENRRLHITVRRQGEGSPEVRVEWYFFARNVNNRQAWVFDAGARDMILPIGRTETFFVESATVRQSDYRVVYESSPEFRSRSGNFLSGYAVVVWSGPSIVNIRGNAPGTTEWLRLQLESGNLRRPEPGRLWNIEDALPRVVDSSTRPPVGGFSPSPR
jgi:hypothetical protein